MTLHLGLRPKPGSIHYPILKVVPLFGPFPALHSVTHVIFTSQTAVECMERLVGVEVVAVGEKTKEIAERFGWQVGHVACLEQAEGVVAVLEKMDLRGKTFCWPRARQARRVIPQFFANKGVPLIELELYDVVIRCRSNLPDLSSFEKIHFTSPSTVHAFFTLYKDIPKHITMEAIGPITGRVLKQYINQGISC